jgi:hypothetical protein
MGKKGRTNRICTPLYHHAEMPFKVIQAKKQRREEIRRRKWPDAHK